MSAPDFAAWMRHAQEVQQRIGALQAFYVREAQLHGWEIDAFEPFPGLTDLGFARFQVRRADTSLTLGLLPYGGERVHSNSPANLVIKKLDRG